MIPSDLIIILLLALAVLLSYRLPSKNDYI
jgi:hypothetical protein